jgi:hypothetical protein
MEVDSHLIAQLLDVVDERMKVIERVKHYLSRMQQNIEVLEQMDAEQRRLLLSMRRAPRSAAEILADR